MAHKFMIDRQNGIVHLGDKSLSFDEFFKGGTGADGKSAFELWLEIEGNEGKSFQDFQEYIKGKDAINVIIESTGGNFFKKGDGPTEMTAIITVGGAFMKPEKYNSLRYEWRCNGTEILVDENMNHVGLYNGSTVPTGFRRTIDITDGSEARRIIVSNEDVNIKANYTCNVYEV